MTNWDRRDLTLPLDFLGPGVYEVQSFLDGPNAATEGIDLTVQHLRVTRADRLDLRLAPGGGAAIILTPKE